MQYVGGAGLSLDVFDATTGKDLGTAAVPPRSGGIGRPFPRRRREGDVLQVHVSGLPGTVAGFGAYTLDIDVLPQVVSVQAEAGVDGSVSSPRSHRSGRPP